MKKRSFYLFLACFLPLLLSAQLKSENTIRSIVKAQLEKETSKAESNEIKLKVKSFHKSKQSNLEHYYFQQSYNGIEIHGTESSIHLTPDGSVFKFNNRLQKGDFSASKIAQQPSINPIQAIQHVAKQLGYESTGKLEVLEHAVLTNRSQKISKGSLSRRPIPVKLVYTISGSGNLILAWDLSIYETKQEEWWSLRVDANSGKIIDKVSWIVSCNFNHGNSAQKCSNHSQETNCKEDHPLKKESTQLECEEKAGFIGGYRVYPMPLAHPGEGGRTLVTNPDNSTASPFGWHDTNGAVGSEFLTTQGNNVHALDAGNNVGYAPNGGPGLQFDFPLDLSLDPELSEDAAQTNLFYWTNIAHDVLYQYGFDESSGNFQENNYGKGGMGSDFVNANSQIGEQCNASFSTPPDGFNPTMSMYVCNGRDGNFANAVVLHEYAHGLSNRLTGGPAAAGCLGNAEQMGEGWSDYIALILTMKPGDQSTDSKLIGNWLLDPLGVREYPYTTDMSVNPDTYVNSFTGTLFPVPHRHGSVWCAMIWEMTWNLIGQYGFDTDFYNGTGGNNIALQLVVEGLKLQPCGPGFVDGRDAILAADQALYGGANQCLIWDAFAKRGLGANADQVDPNIRADGIEAFNIPPPCGGTECLLKIDSISISIEHKTTTNNQVLVKSDGFWTVTKSAPWITLLTTSGTGDGPVFFNVSANSDFKPRTDTIKISCPGFSRNFLVTQRAKPCDQLYASIPYFNNFESGALDNFWCRNSSTVFGQIEVIDSLLPRDTRHLVVGAKPTAFTSTSSTASLGVNLLGKSNVELSFWWKEIINTSNFGRGVYLSDNGGQTYVKVFDLEGGNLAYSKAVLNISQLAVDHGFSLSNTFVIKFEKNDFHLNSYPLVIDDLSIQSITCNVGSPCNDNDPCTVNDVLNSLCACQGTFQDTDGDGICNDNDQCPGFDDNTDLDGDGIADGCDQTSCGCPVTITNYPHVEDFEAGTASICQYSGDDFDWALLSGSTPSTNTGPSAAYQGSYYFYVESSSNFIKQTAFESVCYNLPGSNNAFINFWCHMYGSTIGTLNLEVTTNEGGSWTTIWSRSGDQGNNWFNVNVDISNYSGGKFSYRFTGITGTAFTSDIAIDQITVDYGSTNCVVGSSCDDNDPCTINDVNNALCLCSGTYMDTDLDGVCDPQDQCPGYDDNGIDLDADGIPDDCDQAIFCGSCSGLGAPPNNHLQFDGANDYISLNNMDVSGSELTLEALINSSNLSNCNNDQCRIISKAISPTPNDHYWMLSTTTSGANTVLRFRLKTNDNQPTASLVATTGDLSENTWYHIAATYDGTTMKLFLDGNLVGSMPKTGSVSTNSSVGVWIGGNPPTATGHPWQGKIDEVRIWNTARTLAELQANSSSELSGSEAGLQAYYKFNEGTGQTLKDDAGNNNTVLGSTNSSDTNDPSFVINNSNPSPTIINSYPHIEDFEVEPIVLCQYPGNELEWTSWSGSTRSAPWSGPSSAYQGWRYYVIDSDASRNGEFAAFQSECYDMSAINKAYINFWCHMFGQYMGTLNLEVTTDEGASWTNVWSLSGDQGNRWFNPVVDVSNYTGGSFSYRFTGIVGFYSSDFALDQITVGTTLPCTPGTSCDDNDPCTINDVYGPICNCAGTFEDTDADGICDTQDQCPGYDDSIDIDEDGIPDGCDLNIFCGSCTNNSSINSFPHTEDFETGGATCQYQGDDFDWAVQSGSTSSGNTGPSSAYQGMNYIYMEASSPNHPNKLAAFQSECYDMVGVGGASINFWYHMYGEFIGTLDLEVTTNQGNSWQAIWSLSRDQGDSWHNANIDLSNYTGGTFSYRFIGTTDSSFTGDIALDQITIDVGTPTPSLTFDLKVVLEGAYDLSTGGMKNDLYQLELLPGMLFTTPNQIGQETPSGQPYLIPPWSYLGTEGQTYSNSDYDPTSVDWVLMSLRTGVDATTEIHQAAGILKQDGTIEFLPGSGYQGNVPGPYYILIEHRNHIGALSNQAIMPQGSVLSYDFSSQNSWASSGFGQKQLLPGLWGLYAADGDQILDVVSYDINGADRILWNADNGVFKEYRLSDFNMDGETTGGDRILWNSNTGISSGVPK